MRLREADFEGILEQCESVSPVGWNLSLYPEAREASGRFVATVDTQQGRRGVPGEGVDRVRSAQVAASRARATVRRYCAANRMNRLGTLTYAGNGCHDPQVLRADLASFFKNLRRRLDDKPFPYLWVPEWHKSGHGLHAHFACSQYIKRSLIEEAWGRGFVHIKLLGDLPSGSNAIDEARLGARYLSKYMEKDFDTIQAMGLHRYDRAQGYNPRRVSLPGPTLEEAVGRACRIMGVKRLMKLTTSDQWPGWSGPRAVAVIWES